MNVLVLEDVDRLISVDNILQYYQRCKLRYVFHSHHGQLRRFDIVFHTPHAARRASFLPLPQWMGMLARKTIYGFDYLINVSDYDVSADIVIDYLRTLAPIRTKANYNGKLVLYVYDYEKLHAILYHRFPFAIKIALTRRSKKNYEIMQHVNKYADKGSILQYPRIGVQEDIKDYLINLARRSHFTQHKSSSYTSCQPRSAPYTSSQSKQAQSTPINNNPTKAANNMQQLYDLTKMVEMIERLKRSIS